MSQNFPWFVIFFCVCFRVNIIIPALQKKKKKKMCQIGGAKILEFISLRGGKEPCQIIFLPH